MKSLPIELFMLNLLFNPPQQSPEKDESDSQSKEKNFAELLLPCFNETQFSLSTSFTQQLPLVIMAAESRRHQRNSSLAPDNNQSGDRNSHPNPVSPIPMEDSDTEEDAHENMAREFTSQPTEAEFTLQDQDTIQMYQNDEFALDLLNESIEFPSFEFSEKWENRELEVEQHKVEQNWFDQFYMQYPKEPELLSKGFSIDLLEPSLHENVLDLESLFFNSNTFNVSTNEEKDQYEEHCPDEQLQVDASKSNSGIKNESVLETACCVSTTRSFLQDETSSYCNSLGTSSSAEDIKKEEFAQNQNSEFENSREPIFSANGVANGHGLFRDGSTFGSPSEPSIWDSENIENAQQVSHSQSNFNYVRGQESIAGPQVTVNDLNLDPSASGFNTNEGAERVLASEPEVFGSPLVSHSYVEERTLSPEEIFDEESLHGDGAISPTLMTFNHDQRNEPLSQIPENNGVGPSSSTGNSVYRDEDLLLEMGVHWTNEQITHASLEDFNKLIAAVKNPRHVDTLRGIRKRGKNKLAARRVRSKTQIELSEVRDQIAVLRRRRDVLKHERDLLMQQLSLSDRSTTQGNARDSYDTFGLL